MVVMVSIILVGIRALWGGDRHLMMPWEAVLCLLSAVQTHTNSQ